MPEMMMMIERDMLAKHYDMYYTSSMVLNITVVLKTEVIFGCQMCA